MIIPLIPISNMSSLSLDRGLKFQAATEPTKKKKQNKRFLCTQIQVLICAKPLHWNSIKIFCIDHNISHMDVQHRWDSTLVEGLSAKATVLFSGLYNTVNSISQEAYLVQGRDVSHHLRYFVSKP